MNRSPEALFPFTPLVASETLGIRTWAFDSPLVFGVQLDTESTTVEHAHFLIEAFDLAIDRFGSGRYRCIHDWRRLKFYSAEYRNSLIDWGRRVHGLTESVTVVLAPDTSPLIRMGITVASTALTMVGIKFRTRFDSTMDAALKSLNIHEPSSPQAQR